MHIDEISEIFTTVTNAVTHPQQQQIIWHLCLLSNAHPWNKNLKSTENWQTKLNQKKSHNVKLLALALGIIHLIRTQNLPKN